MLNMVDNMILPPEDNWEDHVYSVIIMEQKAPSLTHVVMAPDQTLHTFEGRDDSSIKSVTVEEFVSSMKNTFQRNRVPLDQRGQFLLDYLCASPKIPPLWWEKRPGLFGVSSVLIRRITYEWGTTTPILATPTTPR